MEKGKLMRLLSDLIDRFYSSEVLEDGLLIEALKDVEEIKELIGEDKFFRELTLLINTAIKSKEERRNNLRIAIISDLEKELERLNDEA